MTPELKRALRQLSMTLPEAEAFVRLRNRWADRVLMDWCTNGWAGWRNGDKGYRLRPKGRFVAEALVRLGVGRKP